MLFYVYISQRVLIKEVLTCNAYFPFRFSDRNLFACSPTKHILYPTAALPCKEICLSEEHIFSCSCCFGQAGCDHPSIGTKV